MLDQWRADLESWAIPDEILGQAAEPPWIHPVSMFTVDDTIADSPSHRRAREALPADGSVLDVGSGGGRAAFALVPPAGSVVAVDHQQAMLDAFAEAALPRGVRSHEYLGTWPAVADDVPRCDVVVCITSPSTSRTSVPSFRLSTTVPAGASSSNCPCSTPQAA